MTKAQEEEGWLYGYFDYSGKRYYRYTIVREYANCGNVPMEMFC